MPENTLGFNEKSQENLKEVYNAIRESLKFIEAKHAGLVAINSGAIFGVVSVYKETGALFHWSQLIILACFSLSLLFSLLAFHPRPKQKKKNNPIVTGSSNLLYSENLASMNKDQFKNIIQTNNTKVLEDMLSWTHNTAGVSARKYRLFRNAVRFTTVGVALAIVVATNYTICLIITN